LPTDKNKQPKKNKPPRQQIPSREDILAFISEHPGQAGKREIARHFGITGSARIPLKALLKELAAEGEIESRNRRLKRPADLPAVSVLDITGRDSDGELVAEPVEWPPERGDPPRVAIARSRAEGPHAGKVPAPGIGDHLRVRSWRGGRLGRDGFACPRTSVGLASLVLPTFRGRQNRGRSRRDSIVLHIDS